jgi:pimeloyl-ACP methyl ester carboxylesterase
MAHLPLAASAGPAPRARHKQAAVAAGDAADTGSADELRPHEPVLLHGQPGSADDWQQVAARLPAQLRVVTVDRPGYGSNPQSAGGFGARDIRQAVLVEHSPDRHVNWQVWAQAGRRHRTPWRTFLAEQRALVRELDELVTSVPSVKAPVLLLADPKDTLVPVGTTRRLAEALPDARLQLVEGVGHHLPRRAHAAVADAVTAFLAAVDSSGSLR